MTQDCPMYRYLPFPYADGLFPPSLGAVVQRTVLDGTEPAREVVHTDTGSWLIGDGVNDPNEDSACIATHISHAVELNSSLQALASMPPGHIAQRTNPGTPWEINADGPLPD